MEKRTKILFVPICHRAAYKSRRTGEREGPRDMGATATIQFETEKDRDAQAIFERSLQVNKVFYLLLFFSFIFHCYISLQPKLAYSN